MHRSITAALAVAALSVSATAAEINYGNFMTPNYNWLQVTEGSQTDAVPLFGAPLTSGDTLYFNPTSNFGATASNGGADTTDGKLNFTLMSKPGQVISSFAFNERGDYSLLGNFNNFAFASVGCTVNFRVLEINNVALAQPFAFQQTLFFAPAPTNPPNVNGAWYLPGFLNLANVVPWTGTLSVNIDAILIQAGLSPSATKIDIALDNQLNVATSDGNTASIFKKQAEGIAITVIPAPGAATLLGLSGLAAARRRRR